MLGRMANADVLTRMRAICADLPSVKEKPHFGDVVFTAGGKIFASCSRTEVVFQPADAMREVVEGDPRFKPYPRDKRAFVMDVSGPTDWNLVKQLVFDSYGLHAVTPTPPTKRPAKATAKKATATKPTKNPTTKSSAKKPTKRR
jgi:hypothetical protein